MTAASSNHSLCPVCGSPAKFAFDHPDLEVWRCTHCGHAYTRPDTLKTVEEYSVAYYEDEHKNWFENPHVALFKWIASTIPDDAKSVIDIGCGRGDFLRHLKTVRPELELVGVDLSPNNSELGITYVQGDIMEMDVVRQYDAVVSLAAIEHMEDPLSFARRLKDYCSNNGIIAVMTVNESGLLYTMARLAKRAGVSFLFDRLYSAHHLNHFSVRSLSRLMTEAGMEVVRVYQHNSPLAAVDLPRQLAPLRWLVLAALAVVFALSTLTSSCLSQTVIARPRNFLVC